MREYQNGEFCKDKKCPNYHILMSDNPAMCPDPCLFTAYEFHNWIIKNGGKIILFMDGKSPEVY